MQFIAYEERNILLSRLGFKDYQAYLNSPLWSGIRKRVLKRDKGKCRLCEEPATQVHHKDYSAETLQGKRLDGLASLCGTCHDLAEFDDGGSKTRLDDANQRLVEFRKGFTGPAKPEPVKVKKFPVPRFIRKQRKWQKFQGPPIEGVPIVKCHDCKIAAALPCGTLCDMCVEKLPTRDRYNHQMNRLAKLDKIKPEKERRALARR